MREAILAHSGEALQAREAFQRLPSYDRDSVIEFLKSLRILPAGTPNLVVDEGGQPKMWPTAIQ
jgi:Di-haem oxidoreductase, putative peroxidase